MTSGFDWGSRSSEIQTGITHAVMLLLQPSAESESGIRAALERDKRPMQLIHINDLHKSGRIRPLRPPNTLQIRFGAFKMYFGLLICGNLIKMFSNRIRRMFTLTSVDSQRHICGHIWVRYINHVVV